MIPDFVIAGGVRCGTTALHYVLQNHPGVAMSHFKEPNFFVFEGDALDFPWRLPPRREAAIVERSVVHASSYASLFAHASKGMLRGEASPYYLSSPGAPKRMFQADPRMKIIIILRHPLDRAYSHFIQHVRQGYYNFSEFGDVLAEEHSALRDGRPAISPGAVPYIEGSRYSVNLHRFYAQFPAECIRVYLYDDLQHDYIGTICSICEFLGIDVRLMEMDSHRYNASGVPRVKALDRALDASFRLKQALKFILPFAAFKTLAGLRHKIQQWNLKSAPPLSPASRQHLMERYFIDDIEALERTLGRRLPGWYE